MSSSVYTFWGTTSPRNTTQKLVVAGGTVLLGQSGLFTPTEVSYLTGSGITLLAGPVSSPASALSVPTLAAGSSGSLNGVYQCAVTFVTDVGETIPGPSATITVSDKEISWSDIPVASDASGVVARRLYRTAAGASQLQLVAEISDDSTTTYTDDVADGSLGVDAPMSDTSFVAVGDVSQFSEFQSLSVSARNQLVQLIQRLSSGGEESSLTVTDGTNSVDDVETLTFSGATVSGSDGDATATITGGGSVTSPDGTIDVTGGTEIDVVYGTDENTAAEGNDSRITGALQKTENLSDLDDASAARTNLGLGTAATEDSTAFDTAGAASDAQTNAEGYTDTQLESYLEVVDGQIQISNADGPVLYIGQKSNGEVVIGWNVNQNDGDAIDDPSLPALKLSLEGGPDYDGLQLQHSPADSSWSGTQVLNIDGDGNLEVTGTVTADDEQLAPLASPTFTGTPKAPTAASGTDSTQVATTAYADAAVLVEKDRAEGVEADLAPIIENVNTVAESGAAQTIPASTSDTINYLTLTADCTLTFPTAEAGESFLLALAQDDTGSRTVTWPDTVKWPGGTAPTLTTTASKTDVFSMICVDGTSWLGFVVGQDF